MNKWELFLLEIIQHPLFNKIAASVGILLSGAMIIYLIFSGELKFDNFYWEADSFYFIICVLFFLSCIFVLRG